MSPNPNWFLGGELLVRRVPTDISCIRYLSNHVPALLWAGSVFIIGTLCYLYFLNYHNLTVKSLLRNKIFKMRRRKFFHSFFYLYSEYGSGSINSNGCGSISFFFHTSSFIYFHIAMTDFLARVNDSSTLADKKNSYSFLLFLPYFDPCVSRFRNSNEMRIHAVPDPKHFLKCMQVPSNEVISSLSNNVITFVWPPVHQGIELETQF